MNILYPPESCACFTGHRALDRDEMKIASKRVAEQIALLYEKGVHNYYAGGALGFDFAASVTLLNLKSIYPKLTLNLALPCHDHTKKWTRAEIELFERVKSRADSCVYVSEEYDRGCMHKRNRYMVDRSRFCVSYLAKKSGGTANTVSYAMKKGLAVINLADSSVPSQVRFDI